MRYIREKQSAANLAGFSLVVTISMMVLLTVVAVGLLTLSSVSLRTASQGQAAADARANARLALMLAIGQLQAELGPDQRINAPADLANQALGGGRQKWVGTWESWPVNVTERPELQFRRWLVSGTPDNLGNLAFPSEASNLVSLLRGDGSDLMAAPKITLPDGGFAYAVADENSKARIGPSLPSANREDLADHLARYQSPPAGHNLLAGLQAVPRNEPLLDRLVSGESADLLPDSQTNLADDTTSFTVWSEGLLTDVRNGGFRKDLSLNFHKPESGDVTKALYIHGGRRGINFQELRNFHEISSRLTYDASRYTHPDGGKLNPKVPCLVGKPGKNEAATDPFFAYLRPMVIRCSWNISAYSRPAPTGGKYNICIVVEPIVWLWNPFDVNLVMNPGGHLAIRCWGIPYDFNIAAGGTNKTVKFSQLTGTGGAYVGLNVAQSSPLVMRPGEVLIYSRGRDATSPMDFKSVAGRQIDAKPGWSSSGGYWIDTGILADGSSPVSISMAPTKDRQATGFAVVEFLTYVGDAGINAGSQWNGGLMIDRGNNQLNPGGVLTANDFPPGMFSNVPTKNFGSAANLAEPQPLALFSYLARTEREGSMNSRYLARLNPAAMAYDHQATDANTLQALPFEPLMQPLSGGLDRGIDYDGGKGFFGASYMASPGQSHLVTHSVPREPPVSLGAFQHALANGVEAWIYNGTTFFDRILQPSITHAIGNSFATPCIAPDQTTGTFNSMPAVDHSWLANDALWDQWFVSSLAERKAPHLGAQQTGTARSLFERFVGLNSDPVPLPNRHYLYAGKNPETDVTELFSGTAPKDDAYLMVASLLRIHGAFNINSTDPAAWLAMFRSTNGLKVPVEPGDGTTNRWETGKNPLAGLLVAKGSAVESNDLTDPSSEDQWTGYRDPDDEELKELADAMVEEVRKRGPFLSLADFVNRRLVSDPALASRGALQAALDRSINKKLESGARSSSRGGRGIAFPDADAGSQMTHVPGHVKQGDILTTLGTRFSPRSDTFTIRAYGESRSPAGTLLASARCEAVIQRNADYIDAADERDTPVVNLTSQANKRFGRKFTMVSFRWLTQSEP